MIAGSHGKITFSLLRNTQTVVQNDYCISISTNLDKLYFHFSLKYLKIYLEMYSLIMCYFVFLKIILFIYSLSFGCAGSSFLCGHFL